MSLALLQSLGGETILILCGVAAVVLASMGIAQVLHRAGARAGDPCDTCAGYGCAECEGL